MKRVLGSVTNLFYPLTPLCVTSYVDDPLAFLTISTFLVNKARSSPPSSELVVESCLEAMLMRGEEELFRLQ